MRFHSRLVDQDETDSVVGGVGGGGAGGVFRRGEPQRDPYHASLQDGGASDPGRNAGLQQHRRVELPRHSRGQATPQLAAGPADGGIRLSVRRQRPGAGDLPGRTERRDPPPRRGRRTDADSPTSGRVEVFRQVMDRGERVGALYLRANTDDLHRELAAYTKIIARRGLARPDRRRACWPAACNEPSRDRSGDWPRRPPRSPPWETTRSASSSSPQDELGNALRRVQPHVGSRRHLGQGPEEGARRVGGAGGRADRRVAGGNRPPRARPRRNWSRPRKSPRRPTSPRAASWPT